MDQRLRSWVTGQYDKRDAINDVSYLWPKSDDGTVEVPYTLSQEILEGKTATPTHSCFVVYPLPREDNGVRQLLPI